MTDLLTAPRDWPRILLGEAATAPATFDGLRRAIRDLGATATIATIAESGLRGRGGAGYLTGDKWRVAAQTEAPRRFVVANGYGADPASHTDRTLMRLAPGAVVEGTAIAAFAIGAVEAFIAVRAEDTDIIAGLEAAIAAATAAGHLGANVHGSGHDIVITVRPVQGAYMLGEETVLLKALEGKRGQPEQRPPHPAESGLHGMPTVVNNVQTLAAVPWIVREGADAFRATGTAHAPGTVLVQIRTPSGQGIAEVPFGTPLRDVIALGAALPKGRSLKAVLIGGPSGGLLPADALDTPFDFDGLRAAGAHVGSGIGRPRRRSDRSRRAGRRPDPVLLVRGLRQDDPVPDRRPSSGRDRRAPRGRPDPPDRRHAGHRPRRRHRGLRACATTSAWPPSR